MCRINFVLSWVEHEKKFITSKPDFSILLTLELFVFQVEEAVAVLQAHQAKESAHQQAASNASMGQQIKKE